MMALNAGPGGELPGISSRSMVSRTPQLIRRRGRSSKGTIAGFVFGKTGEVTKGPTSSPEVNGETVATEHVVAVGAPSSGAQSNQPQHANDTSPSPGKPCHCARVALLCCHNAIRMGAQTRLGLCPPGRPRRALLAALRQRVRSNRQTPGARTAGLQGITDTGGYYGLDRLIGSQSLEDFAREEEEVLMGANTFDAESDEEASSGDEDELNPVNDTVDDASSLDEEKKYVNLREPLFTPTGAESSLSTPGVVPMGAMGTGSSGKLPFNYRKLRYFDVVAAADRTAARVYLSNENDRFRQRSALILSRHLARIQKQERRRSGIERGDLLDDGSSDHENDDPKTKALLTGGVSQFPSTMTPSASAALLLESLSFNPVESIEGMAKCYDGIVAAGVALLESSMKDPTSPSSEEEKSRPTRSEVMAALTPLLITSLEQPSGDVLVHLARLRQMCGTVRYQRRFVQRVAPCLVRPPRGAMWCLRHQSDMEPIIAATELILDSASEVFTKGWYERGQLLLADSKRAETLNTAAMQLRNLISEPSEGLSLALSAPGHGTWRGKKFKAGQSKDSSSSANASLAEWEVIAVDRQIRVSISNIMSMDWSRAVVQCKDPDTSRSYRRNSGSSCKSRPSVLPQASSGDASPKSLTSTPRSPPRINAVKSPPSPPTLTVHQAVPSESLENIFGHSFSPQTTLVVAERSLSPVGAASIANAASMPMSPPLPNRAGQEELESKTFSDAPPPPSIVSQGQTPPRSPKKELDNGQALSVTSPVTSSGSSRRTRTPQSSIIPPNDLGKPDVSPTVPLSVVSQMDKERAPLSPTSVGTGASASEIVPYHRASSGQSTSSSAHSPQTAHYRMLTSTAAERKRTVAACRALRAQITRFEEAFIQLHGRPPKGAAERAPLATTYAQYREWKRAIRADAACRIQALFRGSRTRGMLLGSSNSRISRVVKRQAGRSNTPDSALKSGGKPPPPEHLLEELRMPEKIGEKDPERNTVVKPLSGSVAAAAGTSNYNDIYQNQGGSQAMWSNPIIRRRTNDTFSVSTASTYLPPTSSGPINTNTSDLAQLSLPELQTRKRELKQQLKRYDMDFARRHGRMPTKPEKEPIRHLYETYNALKSEISSRGGESQNLQSPGIHQPALPPQRTVSPPSGPDSGSDESPTGAGSLSVRGKRKQAKSNNEQLPATSTPPGAPSQDLAALKAEKGKLHQMLRSYEKDFFREHRRQVSSFADIRPVASQYRRYKEIKKAIAAIQQGSER